MESFEGMAEAKAKRRQKQKQKPPHPPVGHLLPQAGEGRLHAFFRRLERPKQSQSRSKGKDQVQKPNAKAKCKSQMQKPNAKAEGQSRRPKQTAESRQQKADSRAQTAERRQQSADSRQQSADSNLSARCAFRDQTPKCFKASIELRVFGCGKKFAEYAEVSNAGPRNFAPKQPLSRLRERGRGEGGF